MPAIIYRREEKKQEDMPAIGHNLVPYITTLLLLVFTILSCAALLYFIKKYRQDKGLSSTDSSKSRGLTITAIPFRRNSNSHASEKQALMGSCSPMPLTPDSVPEIRITFPEEEDAQGRRKSARVVIVSVGEAGVGFVRDVPEESLPPYQKHDGFSSVDLEKIGGLKEKETAQWI